MNGAPMIAPYASWTCSPPPPPSSATTGITDSGSAVPTAASSAPTAPAPRSSRWPSHSTAFVNQIAPPTIRTNAAASSSATITPSRLPSRRGPATRWAAILRLLAAEREEVDQLAERRHEAGDVGQRRRVQHRTAAGHLVG